MMPDESATENTEGTEKKRGANAGQFMILIRSGVR
jgi:hypothetical protein